MTNDTTYQSGAAGGWWDDRGLRAIRWPTDSLETAEAIARAVGGMVDQGDPWGVWVPTIGREPFASDERDDPVAMDADTCMRRPQDAADRIARVTRERDAARALVVDAVQRGRGTFAMEDACARWDAAATQKGDGDAT